MSGAVPDEGREGSRDVLDRDPDEIERQLDEVTKWETEYYKRVDKKKSQMRDVRARERQTRKDILDDYSTEEDRQEFMAKYTWLQRVYKLAEEEIADLEEKLEEADLKIRTLRSELADVRRALQEQQKIGVDQEKTIKGLKAEVQTLRGQLKAVNARLEVYHQKYPELEETDSSTPTGSEVSLKTPEGSPEIQTAVIAGPSKRSGSLTPIDDEPAEAVDGSKEEPPLARKASRSSHNSAREDQGKTSTRTRSRTVFFPIIPVAKITSQELRESGKQSGKKGGSRRKSSGSSRSSN